MRYSILILLLVSGCANDNYVAMPNGNGTPEALDGDLHQCRVYATKKHMANKDYSDIVLAGALGGAVGGAIAGAAGGAAVSSGNQDWKVFNLDVESCMRNKGYEGTSREGNS